MSQEAPVSARVLRCPKCRQTISTMRRWRLACTECGHDWEEQSVLSTGDKLSRLATDAWEYLFVAMAWLTILAVAAALIALLVFVVIAATGRGGLAAGLVVAGFVAIMFVVLAIIMRPSMEASARLQWWVPNWRGPRNRP